MISFTTSTGQAVLNKAMLRMDICLIPGYFIKTLIFTLKSNLNVFRSLRKRNIGHTLTNAPTKVKYDLFDR